MRLRNQLSFVSLAFLLFDILGIFLKACYFPYSLIFLYDSWAHNVITFLTILWEYLRISLQLLTRLKYSEWHQLLCTFVINQANLSLPGNCPSIVGLKSIMSRINFMDSKKRHHALNVKSSADKPQFILQINWKCPPKVSNLKWNGDC